MGEELEQEQKRIDLANRIIEARSKVIRFTHIKPKSLFEEIKEYPDFLELNSIQEKAAAILHSFIPVCIECGSKVNFNRKDKTTAVGGWRNFCSRKCVDKSAIIKQKIKESTIKTSLEKYGVDQWICRQRTTTSNSVLCLLRLWRHGSTA